MKKRYLLIAMLPLMLTSCATTNSNTQTKTVHHLNNLSLRIIWGFYFKLYSLIYSKNYCIIVVTGGNFYD